MATAKISIPEQFQYENKDWSRLLEFFRQENTFLKNRLAEVVDHKGDKEFLLLAEHFQNKFIINDELIDELRHDINAHLQLLAKREGLAADAAIIKKQVKLRNEMEYLERDFAKLKNEFNKYLASAL